MILGIIVTVKVVTATTLTIHQYLLQVRQVIIPPVTTANKQEIWAEAQSFRSQQHRRLLTFHTQ
jgi:hypothetical protein